MAIYKIGGIRKTVSEISESCGKYGCSYAIRAMSALNFGTLHATASRPSFNPGPSAVKSWEIDSSGNLFAVSGIEYETDGSITVLLEKDGEDCYAVV